MKKILVALLACLTVLSLSACGTAICMGADCDKEVEKTSENKNPVDRGYLCEECMEIIEGHLQELEELAEEMDDLK